MNDSDGYGGDSIRAAARLAASPRVHAVAVWIATFILLPAAAAVVSWIGAKLDTQMQVTALSGKIDVMSGQIAVATNRQNDVLDEIKALTSAPTEKLPNGGAIFQLRLDMRYAHRNAVRGNAIALSTARTQKGKIAAAKDMLDSYDHKIDVDRKSPSDAAEFVLNQIAVQ